MKRIVLALTLAAGLFIAGPQAQAQYTLVKSVIGTGGGPMSNGSFAVNGTIGQTIVGPVGNSSFAASQGFWFASDQIGNVPVVGYAADGNILEQNVPNPAKGATMIKFRLARRADVVLKVFSMPGQEVATLANGSFEPGDHEVTFVDPKLPSGTYFYQLQVGQSILRRQMMLVQ